MRFAFVLRKGRIEQLKVADERKMIRRIFKAGRTILADLFSGRKFQAVLDLQNIIED